MNTITISDHQGVDAAQAIEVKPAEAVQRGIPIVFGSGFPNLDITPFKIIRRVKAFAIAVAESGRPYLIKHPIGETCELLPYDTATKRDEKRTNGHLKAGTRFIQSSRPLKVLARSA